MPSAPACRWQGPTAKYVPRCTSCVKRWCGSCRTFAAWSAPRATQCRWASMQGSAMQGSSGSTHAFCCCRPDHPRSPSGPNRPGTQPLKQQTHLLLQIPSPGPRRFGWSPPHSWWDEGDGTHGEQGTASFSGGPGRAGGQAYKAGLWWCYTRESTHGACCCRRASSGPGGWVYAL